MISSAICIALYLIIHYDLITCIASVILVIGIWQGDQKKMLVNLASFYLSVIIVIGVPIGLIKSIKPEVVTTTPEKVGEEVKSWMN